MAWTTADIPDCSGRTVVVTGANSGLGFETTKALAAKGAHVVMACRNTERGETARRDIERDQPDASLAVHELDLANLASVEAFAGAVDDEYDRLDALCNNAGVMHLPRRETADGFEMHIGTNHLGHFALTGRLLSKLRATPDSRVVTVSSELHRRGELDFDDLHGEDGYDRYAAYSQSKLANLLFAYELQRRLDAAAADTISVACHPGYAATNLQFAGPEMEGSRLRKTVMWVGNLLFAQDAAQGALPQLYAMTAPGVSGGDFYGPGGFMSMRGAPESQRSNAASHDAVDARRLWELSEEVTGVTYTLADPMPAE
jgi:NAD(P)-dependent dehydrogenase (short-subunit alcohol dehydrogenase family)